MRRGLSFAGVLALTVVMAGPGVGNAPNANAQESVPAFWVSPDFHEVFGSGWPAQVDLTVTADDPATQLTPDLETTLATDAEGSLGYHDVLAFRSGWSITLGYGGITKTHVVGNVTITDIDLTPGSSHLAGMADPGSAVLAGPGTHPAWGERPIDPESGVTVFADSDGHWSAPFPDGLIDAYQTVAAQQVDEDGDFTFTVRARNNSFFVGLDCDCWDVSGDGWPTGVSVTVTADDPATTTDPDIVMTLVTNEFGSFFDPTNGFGARPGWLFTVTDGVNVKEHTVRDISITYVDPATDVMRGTADPGTEVDAGIVGPGGSYTTTANESGVWAVVTPGDLVPGVQVAVTQEDDDGDRTVVIQNAPASATLTALLNDMLAQGELPSRGVLNSIVKLAASKAPLKALENHLADLVRRNVIAEPTMDQILDKVAG